MLVKHATVLTGWSAYQIKKWIKDGKLRWWRDPVKRLHVDPEDVWSLMGRRKPNKSNAIAAYIRVFDSRSKHLIQKQAARIKAYADYHGLVVSKVWIEHGPGQCVGHTNDSLRKERHVLSDFLIAVSQKKYAAVIVDSKCRFHILADELIIPYFRMSSTELISLNDWYQDPDYMEEQVKEAAVLLESLKSATERNAMYKKSAVEFGSHGNKYGEPEDPDQLEIMANMGAPEPDAPIANDYRPLTSFNHGKEEDRLEAGGTLKGYDPNSTTESEDSSDLDNLAEGRDSTTE